MNETSFKTCYTLGCCGIDCGLCPRYYTEGSSRCPGCYGPDFAMKHPSCPFITCCVKKRKLEVCAQCGEFPCSKFEGWDAGDSFVTHLKSISNLRSIKKEGLETFIARQRKRMSLLETMLGKFDDGKSKSFYCLAAALLDIESLEKVLVKAEKETATSDIKTKAGALRGLLNELALKEGIELRLRKAK